MERSREAKHSWLKTGCNDLPEPQPPATAPPRLIRNQNRKRNSKFKNRNSKFENLRPQFGSANATYASPLFVPILPPPHAITTNCRPSTSYVAGVA